MRVITLLENRTISKELKNKHGLSLYIETQNHKILFDTGTDDTFANNARKLGVNLEEVDIAVISHGHYDHGGGLETFLKINSKAKVYIGKGAFDSHIIKLFGIIKYSIGMKKELSRNDRIVYVDGTLNIDDELTLFGAIKGSKLAPKGNNKLLMIHNGQAMKDDFEHEINLLINEKNKFSLFCGCAHKGIVNIIERAKSITGGNMSTVIGGFHLMGMNTKESSTQDFLNELCTVLNKNKIDKFYTCHCTDDTAYKYLTNKMSNLNLLKTGMIIEV